MDTQISKNKIIEVLNMLNVKYIDKGTDWIQCSCPFPGHIDKNPSAGININTGIFNCFSCDTSKHIISVIIENFKCSYSDALDMLDIETEIKGKNMNPIRNLKQQNPVTLTEKPIQPVIKEFKTTNYDFMKFEYSRLRGFEKEFCNRFNIELAVTGFYKNYMIIPITGNKVNAFEARKVMEYEYLCKYFKIENETYNNLKNRYRHLKENNLIEENIYSTYLNKPKTLYPKNSYINQTIFNYNNLDINEDLYVVEGMGSVPKIYLYISKNVTCTFGSKISIEQLKLLRKFKRIILIPDNDRAGLNMCMFLRRYLFNVWAKDIIYEDTDIEYVDSILCTKEIEIERYLTRKIFKSQNLK